MSINNNMVHYKSVNNRLRYLKQLCFAEKTKKFMEKS